MNSMYKASHANETVTDSDGSSAAVVAKPAAAATAAGAAHSADDIGLASQSSKSSSQVSIAAAATAMLTRLIEASTDHMSATNPQASDGSDAGQIQLCQPEEADPIDLGEASKQAGSGLPINGTTALYTSSQGDKHTDLSKSFEHNAARHAREDLSDVAMADGSKAVDDVVTEEAEAAGHAVVSMTDTLAEAQNRLVSCRLCMQSDN